ncbi:MAG: oligosaccharide flippase family protein [Deltaproteobacteria bacterium]|nr:oligosaccharide flippase family protein [Deltaproteobacteria bacterium]
MQRIKRLVYLGGIYSIGSSFEAALAFFLIPIYTTYLGTYDYGIVGLMSITVGLVSKLICPPTNSGFLRYYYAPEYKDKKGLLLYNSFLFLGIQSFVLSILFYLFRNIISTAVLENNDLTHIVEIYALILFFKPLSQFFLTFLRQIERAGFFIVISWLRLLITAAVILWGLIYLKIGVLALIYGTLVGVVIDVVCVFPLFLKHSTHKVSFSVLGLPLKYGYPLILSGLSLLLIESGDRYVLRVMSSLSDVGLYSFGYTIAGIMLFLLVVPLKQALHPITFKQESRPEQLKGFLKRNCTYFYFVGMFFCLFLSLYSKEVIQIMARKETFWGSWVIVPIITFSYLQHGVGNFVGWGLVMTKKTFYISINVLIAAIVNIGLNILFIPYWGIIGAAVATLFSYFVWNSLKLYFSAKYYGLYFDLKRLLHITVTGVLLYGVSLFIARTGTMSIDMAIKFIVLLSFPLTVYTTGFFTVTEKEHLRMLWVSLREDGLRTTFMKIRAL